MKIMSRGVIENFSVMEQDEDNSADDELHQGRLLLTIHANKVLSIEREHLTRLGEGLAQHLEADRLAPEHAVGSHWQ